ncbi:MAG: hypothetical protein QFB87_00520 [Patescibacteria group bacterium]|nr:hypothetical protein [Patescibacteria group bacterium]
MAEIERDLGLRSQTIDTFQSEISTVQAHRIFSLPDVTEHINHTGKYTRPDIKLASGLFLNRTDTEEALTDYGAKPDAYSFITQHGHRLGREKSHNEVFFGKLLSHWHDDEPGCSESQVAVKPTKNRAALLGELAMFQYMRKLDIPTFEPTAFLVAANGGTDHLLTRFEKPVATMDTVEWQELGTPEKWDQLEFAVNTMALLHSELLFHGDLEFKNVGFGEKGDLIVIDPELTISSLAMAEVAETSSDPSEVAAAQLRIKQSMSTDFTSVCLSIDEFIISSLPARDRPDTNAAKFRSYARHLFRPYKEGLIERRSPHLEQLLIAYEKVFADHKLRSRE